VQRGLSVAADERRNEAKLPQLSGQSLAGRQDRRLRGGGVAQGEQGVEPVIRVGEQRARIEPERGVRGRRSFRIAAQRAQGPGHALIPQRFFGVGGPQ
jgi:hypothetical protein